VSLWMCENGTGHEESRGPTRRRLCCTPFQNFSQRERDVEECHRRVGRVGPEHRSIRRDRGEQRRPLRRRIGTVGACPPPLRGRSAVVARNAACTSGGPTIDSHVDSDLTGACRHHVFRRYMRAFQSCLRLREIPHWGILGRCGPPTCGALGALGVQSAHLTPRAGEPSKTGGSTRCPLLVNELCLVTCVRGGRRERPPR